MDDHLKVELKVAYKPHTIRKQCSIEDGSTRSVVHLVTLLVERNTSYIIRNITVNRTPGGFGLE